MSRECVKEGATVEEALAAAYEELGIAEYEAEYEVLVGDERLEGQSAEVRVWEYEPTQSIDDEEYEEGESSDDEEEDYIPTEEELDAIADTAIEVLRSLLAYFGAEDATIDEYEGDEGEILLDIIGDDLAVLIGRHGKTLDALQLLVTSITNRKLDRRYPVVIDVGGYKYRRRQKLEGVARNAASRAVKQKRDIRLRPMNPYERRIVHIALRDNPRVTTMSEGEEPFRMVVVKPLKR